MSKLDERAQKLVSDIVRDIGLDIFEDIKREGDTATTVELIYTLRALEKVHDELTARIADYAQRQNEGH